jgi:hypothetical protein
MMANEFKYFLGKGFYHETISSAQSIIQVNTELIRPVLIYCGKEKTLRAVDTRLAADNLK